MYQILIDLFFEGITDLNILNLDEFNIDYIRFGAPARFCLHKIFRKTIRAKPHQIQ